MLLTVFDLIEAGDIPDGWVRYDVRLVSRFRDYWELVQDRQRNSPDIPMPFNALGGDKDLERRPAGTLLDPRGAEVLPALPPRLALLVFLLRPPHRDAHHDDALPAAKPQRLQAPRRTQGRRGIRPDGPDQLHQEKLRAAQHDDGARRDVGDGHLQPNARRLSPLQAALRSAASGGVTLPERAFSKFNYSLGKFILQTSEELFKWISEDRESNLTPIILSRFPPETPCNWTFPSSSEQVTVTGSPDEVVA